MAPNRPDNRRDARTLKYGRIRSRGLTACGLLRLLSLCSLAALVATGCATGNSAYDRAVEHHERGRLAEAIREYRRAIELDPRDPKPAFNLAVIYQDQGRSEEARGLYQEILSVHPGYASALVNLAAIHEKEGSFGEAEITFQRAMEADRMDPAPPSQFGFSLMRRGRTAEAAEAFREALRRSPDWANAHFGLGMCALESESRDESKALEHFESALRYNPADRAAALEAARILEANGKLGRATAILEKASSLEPEDPAVFLHLGKILGRQGRWKEAEKALEKALALGALPSECHRELSRIYERLAEESSAAEKEVERTAER